MKKKINLLTVIAIITALAIGFLIGLSVESPRLNIRELSGTIGKVNNYRNTKVTEADIELKNELLADSMKLKLVKKFITFFYVRSIEFGENIDFAVTTANANDVFKTKYANEIAILESYGKFLGTARKDLLFAVAACQSVEKIDAGSLRGSIAQANNIIAQMNYRNTAILNFITVLDSFIQEKGISNDPELNKVHDILTYNQIGSSILVKDKILLKYFDQKKFYSNDLKSSASIDFKANIQKDVEQLGKKDMEELGSGYTDFEQLGWHNEAKLSQELLFDVEELGAVFIPDAEKLGVHNSKESGVWDAEKLGHVVYDSEKLRTIGPLDSECLSLLFPLPH